MGLQKVVLKNQTKNDPLPSQVFRMSNFDGFLFILHTLLKYTEKTWVVLLENLLLFTQLSVSRFLFLFLLIVVVFTVFERLHECNENNQQRI